MAHRFLCNHYKEKIGFARIRLYSWLGSHISNFVFSAQNVESVVAIDGCPVGCAMRLLEHGDVPVFALRVIDEVKEVKDCPELDPVKKTKLTQYLGRFNRES